MVNHKVHTFNANEDVLVFLSSKLIQYMLHWRFRVGNEIPVNCLFTKWKWIYIYWVLNFEDEVHLTWALWTRGFKNAKATFLKSGGTDNVFRLWSEKLWMFLSRSCSRGCRLWALVLIPTWPIALKLQRDKFHVDRQWWLVWSTLT